MKTISITVHFDRGYIADPYWPEVSKLIDIQKHSGINRAKSDANRRKALEEYLKTHEMTLENYKALEIAAKRPFYTDSSGQIIIPVNSVESFLVATCDTLRSRTRPCPPNEVRSRFTVTAWATGKTESDGVWTRNAVVRSGSGQTLSNQRGIRNSHYISNFDATGTIAFNPEFVDEKTLRQAVVLGGQMVGIGASRKMGWGKFEVLAWEEKRVLKAA